VIGWLALEQDCETKQILNHSVKEILANQSILGLQIKDQQWFFKSRPINEHERDALVVF